MFNKNKNIIKQIAAERIEILFNEAQKMHYKNSELSKKYIKNMKMISSHYKVKIPKDIKKNICRKCNNILIPGYNSSIRIASSKGYIIKKCLSCGNELHIFYKNKLKKIK
ncbi:MAG: ribonuclease P [Candidatus Marsarchaeota archaeon]|nr:ribonuclease P [Candidatus Marsarchaeota archaeon]